eukprot:COSAG06_NODE_892_length_11717_cov_58.481752_3_plen_118_part_00
MGELERRCPRAQRRHVPAARSRRCGFDRVGDDPPPRADAPRELDHVAQLQLRPGVAVAHGCLAQPEPERGPQRVSRVPGQPKRASSSRVHASWRGPGEVTHGPSLPTSHPSAAAHTR